MALLFRPNEEPALVAGLVAGRSATHTASRAGTGRLNRPYSHDRTTVTAIGTLAGRPDAGSANPADGGSGPDGLRDLGHLVHHLEKVGELIGWGSRTDFD